MILLEFSSLRHGDLNTSIYSTFLLIIWHSTESCILLGLCAVSAELLTIDSEADSLLDASALLTSVDD